MNISTAATNPISQSWRLSCVQVCSAQMRCVRAHLYLWIGRRLRSTLAAGTYKSWQKPGNGHVLYQMQPSSVLQRGTILFAVTEGLETHEAYPLLALKAGGNKLRKSACMLHLADDCNYDKGNQDHILGRCMLPEAIL